MLSLLGCCLICLSLPLVLIWLRNAGEISSLGMDGKWNFTQLVVLIGISTVILTLGILFFANIGVRAMRGRVRIDSTFPVVVTKGACGGAVLSLVHAPGTLGLIVLHSDYKRLILLHVVAGALCGAWIGWQMYCERRGETRFFPTFGIRTLCIGVLALDLLIYVFLPG
ncbi:MAG TPA: hypothetical protein VGP72_25475 [Planctomycetota bacterium]